MEKGKALHYMKNMPELLKMAAKQAKELFDKHGEDAFEDVASLSGLIIKIFGKLWVDKYFEKQTEKKLEDFGHQVYVKAGFAQAEESLGKIKRRLPRKYQIKDIISLIEESFKDSANDFNVNDLVLVFKPKEHPAIKFVRENYSTLLRRINVREDVINEFLKNYNDNIEATIKGEFGEDLDDHLKDVAENWLDAKEEDFLIEMKRLGRIGMTENEDLTYETTYAKWERVENFRRSREEEDEEGLSEITELIDEYFKEGEEYIQKVLFIVTDFGKGKSVFLKHYAADLATKYLQTGDGLFPVYFNLREFGNQEYSRESKLGVVSNYLAFKHGIKIEDDSYKKKNFVFLLDSLDESGELTQRHLDSVIDSITRIQELDTKYCRTNRVIVTSRPIDEGLQRHLSIHEPMEIEENEQKIPLFICLYGFKKEQFNDWMIKSLRNHPEFEELESTGFAQIIVDNIRKNNQFDVYEELVKKRILTASELRRPLFAYILYKLIIKNSDFASAGKIGVYLAFLNLLTKEAKHKEDPDYRVDILEEARFRNILHATAALWTYQRQYSQHSTLRKTDICKTIEGKPIETKDAVKKYKEISDLKFLSHSYFGEEGDQLHFQHQSFAEILLAEYYLKVFIKYALDKDADFEEARVRLVLGEPTEQTVLFFKDLLQLLKETATDTKSKIVADKRKQLFPLIMSLATEEYSKGLFCSHIFYTWNKELNGTENMTEIDDKLIENWPIDNDAIDKIIKLAKGILESETNYLFFKGTQRTPLFDKEAIEIPVRPCDSPPDIDRWLALTVGESLYTNEKAKKFFAGLIENFSHFFDMMKSWNYVYDIASPTWGRNLFKGLNMERNEKYISLGALDLGEMSFNNSYLKNLAIWSPRLFGCDFTKVTFESVEFFHSLCMCVTFDDIKVIGKGLTLYESRLFVGGVIIPVKICELLQLGQPSYLDFPNTFIGKSLDIPVTETGNPGYVDIFNTIRGLLVFGLKNKYINDTNEIKGWFDFDDEAIKTEFHEMIDTLKIHERKKTKPKKNRKK